MTRDVLLVEGENPAGRTAARRMAQEPENIISRYTDAQALEDGVLVAMDAFPVNRVTRADGLPRVRGVAGEKRLVSRRPRFCEPRQRGSGRRKLRTYLKEMFDCQKYRVHVVCIDERRGTGRARKGGRARSRERRG